MGTTIRKFHRTLISIKKMAGSIFTIFNNFSQFFFAKNILTSLEGRMKCTHLQVFNNINFLSLILHAQNII